tara:strand:- start:1582 stop:1947 length:366 start_codon:yes stop_codon:yes gene_type:complete
MTIVDNKEKIVAKKNEQRHEIGVDRDNPDEKMEVWVRDITFFDVQKAAQSLFVMEGEDVRLDLEGYWNYAFNHWILRTNPELSSDELANVSAFVGQQLAALLPKPDELAEVMQGGFTSANN